MAAKSVATQHRQHLIRAYLPELVLLGTAGGFAITFVELLVTDHSEGTQAIGVIAAGIGVVLCVIGLMTRSRIILRTLALGLLLLSISGPLGVFLHAGGEVGASEASYPVDTVLTLDADDDGENGEGEGDEDEETPPLAPLGLLGLGFLGAVAVLARED